MLEDVVKKVSSVLQAGLPAKLNSIEIARGDGIVLRDIASFFISRFELDNLRYYPALFTLGDYTSMDDMLAVSPKRDVSHIIRVIIILSERDDETLQKKLWRYAEAVEGVIINDRTLGGSVLDTYLVEQINGDRGWVESHTTYIRPVFMALRVKERYNL